MRRWIETSIALTLGAVLSGTSSFPSDRPGDAKRGRLVYQRYCVSCHGPQGDGQGESAEFITPKPRDFRQGIYKWRSTPSGSLPTDADLDRTIKNGLYGTHMPRWYPIGPASRADVIAYLKTFSDRWTKESPGPSLQIPPEPPNDDASVGRGRAIYQQVGCDRCHGDHLRGDGPSARDLKDDWENPINPYNLRTSHYKCGDTAADIYRSLLTGLNGTPMPSFRDALKDEEAWDLVHYILSLGPEGRPAFVAHER